MKLKNLMMSAGAAALIAGGSAYAQDKTTEATDAPAMSEAQEDMGNSMTGIEDATGTTGEMYGETTGDVAAAAPMFTSIEEMTVGDVIGYVAYDPKGDRIGDIDYVIDRDGEAQAVIGIGGFLGLGEYTVALPLSDFELRDDGMSFELATDKETLKKKPEIDEASIESVQPDVEVSQLIVSTDTPSDAETDAAGGSDAQATEEPMEETDMEDETETQ
ncbi:MAG TPA: hypothetical protein DEO85_00445 [Maritimibacter sp.]|nr:hypothetical protein [Maritimibacter sp.]